MPPAKRHPEDIIRQQKEDAARLKQQKAEQKAASQAVAVSKPAPPPATPEIDNRTPQQRYVDEIAPSGIAGRLVKFSKEGRFVTADDDQPIDDNIDFFALCDETQIGWIKFSQEEGVPPERRMGLLYDGFVMPRRESLGDLEPNEWPEGLSGQPEDVWRHQINLVMQQTDTRELFTFSTQSMTGRRAVGNLLRHYDRNRRAAPGDVPIIRLRAGGFQHKDERIGWVSVPVFAVVGHAPRDNTARPELPPPDTSVAADMNDAIPV